METTDGDVVLALFFLHYWTVTRARFFLFFTLSFLLGGTSRLALAGHLGNDEFEYLIRFLSYVIILVAIIDKNHVSIAKLLFQRT